MDGNEGFACTVTGFEGFEEEILRVRNANRDRPETLDYLNWRYRSARDAPPPRVFWLSSPEGERVGMGSAVFRPYWVKGLRVQIAVLGDISLATPWRGRGLGLRLMRFMTAWLDEHFPNQPAFVIPTEPARRALAKAGWVTAGSLVPHVYVLDGAHYLKALLRSEGLASPIALSLRSLARFLARLHIPRDGTLRLTNVLEAPLLEFAQGLPVTNRAVRDLGPESLLWRYAQHPHTRFSFAAFSRAGQLRGLLVYEAAFHEQSWLIYDVAAMAPADVRAMLALFILRGLDTQGLASLRVLVSERHPWNATLRALGFIRRPAEAVFQVHSSNGAAEALGWCVTQGDKDT